LQRRRQTNIDTLDEHPYVKLNPKQLNETAVQD